MESIQDKKKSCTKEIGVSFMHFFSTNPRLKILALTFLLFVPTMAFADDGEGNNTAVTIGWIGIILGIIANLSLVTFKIIRKPTIMKLVGGYDTQGLAPLYTPMLNFHILLNSIGFVAGLSHGLMLIRGLDAISLSLAIIMTVSMISGIILKYTPNKNTKFFGRLVHGQFILAALLITLVILHVLTHSGSFD
jgi:hypothetical protein